ncbi:MAG: helix-turn-helix domain-containing protein [Pseudomonadota bacterium]
MERARYWRLTATLKAYFSLVLRGSYEERSVDGRFTLGPGSILYHPPQHLHANSFAHGSAQVLNASFELRQCVQYRVAHLLRGHRFLERLMRGQSNRLASVVEDILHESSARPCPAPPWLVGLSEALRDCGNEHSLNRLCRDLGVSPAHASRAFRRHFDACPSEFRREYRLRAACAALTAGLSPTRAAQRAGFADQSHLGRVMKAALGLTPVGYARTRRLDDQHRARRGG